MLTYNLFIYHIKYWTYFKFSNKYHSNLPMTLVYLITLFFNFINKRSLRQMLVSYIFLRFQYLADHTIKWLTYMFSKFCQQVISNESCVSLLFEHYEFFTKYFSKICNMEFTWCMTNTFSCITLILFCQSLRVLLFHVISKYLTSYL